jgi:hypothetical protein
MGRGSHAAPGCEARSMIDPVGWRSSPLLLCRLRVLRSAYTGFPWLRARPLCQGNLNTRLTSINYFCNQKLTHLTSIRVDERNPRLAACRLVNIGAAVCVQLLSGADDGNQHP